MEGNNSAKPMHIFSKNTRTQSAIALGILCGSMLATPALSRSLSVYEQALENIDEEKYELAVPKLKQLIAQDSSNADAHAELARVYMDLENHEGAIAEATRAIELAPKMARAYATRAYCEFRLNRIKEGFADTDKVIKYYTPNPLDASIWNTYRNRCQAYKMLGRTKEYAAEQPKAQVSELIDAGEKAREAGQLDDALQKINLALKSNSQVADLWFMKGVINSNQNNNVEAIADLSTALKLAPNVPMLYYFRGDCYQQLGKHQEAISDFTQIIKAKPKLVAYRFVCETGRLRNELIRDDTSPISLADAYVLRAQSYAAIKKPELAAKDLDAAGKLDPTDDKAFAKKAELTMTNGNFDQAIKEYTKSVAANPKDWTRYKERADAYLQSGKNEEALSDFSEVIKLTPTDPGAYMLRALALKSLKRYAEAIPDFSKTLELRADDDDAYMERSDCYRLMHRYKDALADLDKVAALLPANNNFVREARAKILAESGEKETVLPETPKLEKQAHPTETQKDDNKIPLFIAAAMIAAALLAIGFYLFRTKSKLK
ncbi:MAG: tetratricopeptide repeat protein [Candidatus Melainabacteria bacterium]|nr:tetratricopeptide repeat protein [Candidatus Melainabacteria bacterium]